MATAIFTRRSNPALSVVLFEGARQPGAKILVSGGVPLQRHQHRGVGARLLGRPPLDHQEGAARADRRRNGRVLPRSRRRPARGSATASCFPTRTDRATSSTRCSARCRPAAPRFSPATVSNASNATARGFEIETSAGHPHRVTRRARDRRTLAAEERERRRWLHVRRTAWPFDRRHHAGPGAADPRRRRRGFTWSSRASRIPRSSRCGSTAGSPCGSRGSLLWTHFGISGPVALNASRHWLRAQEEGRDAAISVNFYPGLTFDDLDRQLTSIARSHPRMGAETALATGGGAIRSLPASVARAVLPGLRIAGDEPLSQLARDDRRLLVRALTERPLPLSGSRGYNYAEVTAGGVDLAEIDPVDDGIAGVSGGVSGGRGAGRRRPDRRVQLPVGVVERPRGGARAHSLERHSIRSSPARRTRWLRVRRARG